MFSFLRQTFGKWARSGTRAGAQRAPVRRLECETLEDRMLPSLTGAEFLINKTTPKPQSQAATASSSTAGRSIVVWTETKSSLDSDIKGQIFDSLGRKVGGELLIATGREKQYTPAVAMDSRGN